MNEQIVYEIIGKIVFYLILIYICHKLLKGFYTCFVAKTLGFGNVWRPSPDSWAVITGATDGIGLQYAHRLADMGYSLMIISRSEDKLQIVKKDILSKNAKCHHIKTLAVDFTSADIYDTIERQLSSLDVIDVLVNNVGMSFRCEYTTKIQDLKQFIESIINCNVISMTKMIGLVLPEMVDRRRGIIINVSSLSATYPVPLLAMYSATKVYCDYMSRSLHYEYKDKGIVIQSVLPGFVSTNMSLMRPSFTCPTAHDFVSEAIKTVGIESRTYGHYAHKLQGFIQDFISRTIGQEFNSRFAFKHLKAFRLRYYLKHGLKDQ